VRNNLTVWSPFERAMDSIFQDFDSRDREGVLRTVLDETDNEYILRAEVPGLSEDDIDVSFENGVISLKAHYKEEGKNIFREGTWARAYRAPDVDGDNVNAELKDGVLVVTLPKAEKAKPKRIAIKSN